ncbi:hypothetical protein EJB05_15552, partial [Eragrostis curvula]
MVFLRKTEALFLIRLDIRRGSTAIFASSRFDRPSPPLVPQLPAARRLPPAPSPPNTHPPPPGSFLQLGKARMDHHLPQQQQYGDPYRTLVPSPQPDHHPHALQYHQQQPQQTLMSPPQPQPTLMSPPQPQPQPMLMSPPQQHHASLASHFHLLHLVTKLADAIGTGTRDPNFDSLVEELTSQFARCQQLLNSISGTISSKSTTVEGQRQSLEETRQLLDQRKDLIAKYRSSVEDLIKGDTR